MLNKFIYSLLVLFTIFIIIYMYFDKDKSSIVVNYTPKENTKTIEVTGKDVHRNNFMYEDNHQNIMDSMHEDSSEEMLDEERDNQADYDYEDFDDIE